MPDASAVNWSKEDVLAYAAERGHAVTLSQFDRWRKRGLLPSPVLRGRGRGSGMLASYPESAGPQLVAVAEQLAANRSVEAALWRLWWNGFPIEATRIRAILETALADIEERSHVAERLYAEDSDDFAAAFEARALSRVTDRDLGRLRRRLGKARYATFHALLFEIASGAYTSHDRADAALLAKGLGVERATWFTPQAAHAMSRAVQPDRLRTAFDGAQSADLSSARDELRVLLERALPLVLQQPEEFFNAEMDKGFAHVLAEGLDDLQPTMVLLWLPVRSHALFPTLFRAFSGLLQRPVAEWPDDDLSTLIASA